MRALFYLSFLVFLLTALYGCDKKNEEPLNSNREREIFSSSLEEALSYAEDFFQQIGANTRTPRAVKDVKSLCMANTRGTLDTILYLVNYDNNSGFALLGANAELNDIYAISPKGNLSFQDIDENPVLNDFFQDVISYVAAGSSTDSLTIEDYYRYRLLDRRIEMISSEVSNWTQLAPFNQFCPSVGDKHAYVGCIPLSLGMLLSYYEYPYGINYTTVLSRKFNFQWDAMLYGTIGNSTISRSTQDSIIARMLTFLGNEELLNVTYSTDPKNLNSKTAANKIVPSIRKLGFRNNVLFNAQSMQFHMDSIVNFLLRGRVVGGIKYKYAPLIAVGVRPQNRDNQHAWIVDGVITRERIRTNKNGQPISPFAKYTKALPLWHCIWGMHNRSVNYDGWYVYLKDQAAMDTLQYDPDSKKVNLNGMWPTGVRMYAQYNEWQLFGGCAIP